MTSRDWSQCRCLRSCIPLFSRRIVPSFVVDVSGFVDEKMDAIKAYASQVFDAASKEPSTRISQRGFLNEIEFRMRYFGSLIGR